MINDYIKTANYYLYDIITEEELDFCESLDNGESYDTFIEKLKQHNIYRLYIIQQLVNNRDNGLWDINVGLQETINHLWEFVKDTIKTNETPDILCEV